MKDILLDATDDFDFSKGDFLTGDATGQNQKLLLGTSPGEWKESPVTGVGMEEFLDDEGPDDLFKEIREQFKMDGQVIKLLKVTPDGDIGLDAAYK